MNCPMCKSRITMYVECDKCDNCNTLIWENIEYLAKRTIKNTEFEFVVFVEDNYTHVRFSKIKPKSKEQWQPLCTLNYAVNSENLTKTLEKLTKLIPFS